MTERSRPRAIRAILDKAMAETGPVDAGSVAALHGSIIGSTLKPTSHGGSAKRLAEYVSEVDELAALDGSLGWLAAMFNAAAFEVAGLPAHVADEVWGADADALIAAAWAGNGTVAGDRRLSGRWGAVVGAGYADWLLLPADDDGRCRVLVPRRAVRIESSSHDGGLGGAGVRRVSVSGLAVADRHIFRDSGNPAVAGAGAAAAVVGSADGVWCSHVQRVRARLATSYGGDEVTDEAAAQVAWAASDIDAAKLQVTTSLELPDDHADSFWVYRQAVARARAAADRLLGSSRHALDASDPVAQRWRDVHAGARLAVAMYDAR